MDWGIDEAAGRWIGRRLSGWGVVGAVAPRGFEAYARILHPVPASHDGGPDGEHAWPWAEVARRTGRVMHPLVQWDRLGGDEQWLRFDDGWHAGRPRTGWLDPRRLSALASALGTRTTTPDDLVIGVWTGWGELTGASAAVTFTRAGDRASRDEADALERERALSVSPELGSGGTLDLPGREYALGATSVAELADPGWPLRAGMGWTSLFAGPMPQLIWPADRAWFVASEIDWDSTVVGGSRAAVDAVLALGAPGGRGALGAPGGAIEAFEVGPDDDLSSDGDTINAPLRSRSG